MPQFLPNIPFHFKKLAFLCLSCTGAPSSGFSVSFQHYQIASKIQRNFLSFSLKNNGVFFFTCLVAGMSTQAVPVPSHLLGRRFWLFRKSPVFLVLPCNAIADFCIQQSLAYIPKCQIFLGNRTSQLVLLSGPTNLEYTLSQ